MNLSDTQNLIVMHGLGKQAWWEPRELPTQAHDLPDWLLDAHVDMMLHASNRPEVKFKISRDPWPVGEPKLYEDEGGGAWTARSSDGHLLLVHYHSGKVFNCVGWRVMYDGEIVTQARKDGWQIANNRAKAEAEATKHLELCQRLFTQNHPDPTLYSLEYCEIRATEQQGGYGGSHFHIQLKSGGTLVLRGPWHGGSPEGWSDTVVVDMSSKYNSQPQTRPWHLSGGSFGFYMSDELILKAVAKFQPHLGVAWVYPGYGQPRYQFYDLNWGAPKAFAKERLPGWGPAK